MDYRGDLRVFNQTLRYETEGRAISVSLPHYAPDHGFERLCTPRLRDGRSIRTVSALLLQLVQTSAHGVRIEARRFGKARQQTLALRRQDSMVEKAEEPFLDDKDMGVR